MVRQKWQTVRCCGLNNEYYFNVTLQVARPYLGLYIILFALFDFSVFFAFCIEAANEEINLLRSNERVSARFFWTTIIVVST